MGRPRFDVTLDPKGYGWFYLDGLSDDGKSSVVIIAMLGNVFSTRWRQARKSDPGASSLDFSTMNVAVRQGNSERWALTERPSSAVTRSRDHVAIGESSWSWENDTLVACIREKSAPWGAPVRGVVRLTPLSLAGSSYALDPCTLHTWSPRIPVGHLEVAFDEPRVRFSGTGYLDMNVGQCPLEETFDGWSWSRVALGEQVAIAYDVVLRDGRRGGHSLRARPGGALLPAESGAPRVLPSTRFGLVRTARPPLGALMNLVKTVEDGPFYARSIVQTTLDGQAALGMHETLSMRRFCAGWVQCLVPWKTRREAS